MTLYDTTNMIEVDFSQHRIINKAMSQSWFEEIKESCIRMRGWGVMRERREVISYTQVQNIMMMQLYYRHTQKH